MNCAHGATAANSLPSIARTATRVIPDTIAARIPVAAFTLKKMCAAISVLVAVTSLSAWADVTRKGNMKIVKEPILTPVRWYELADWPFIAFWTIASAFCLWFWIFLGREIVRQFGWR